MRKVLDLIVKENWAEINNLDELNRELAARRVLSGFTALQPSFPPTFKRVRNIAIPANSTSEASPNRWTLRRPSAASDPSGAEEGNLSPAKPRSRSPSLNDDDLNGQAKSVTTYYDPKRLPSYTDRILYKSLETYKSCLQPLFFESCEEVMSSDHKPVRAGFEVSLVRGASDILVDKLLISGGLQDAEYLTLHISDLKGYNLEEMDSQMFGGGSDPYISFYTDPPSLQLSKKGKVMANPDPLKSSVILHNLNPVWKETLTLRLASIDLYGMAKNASLLLTVWDMDRMNAHDLIGAVSIPFHAIFEALIQGDYVFETDIHSNAEVMGRISGRISCKDFAPLLDKAKVIRAISESPEAMTAATANSTVEGHSPKTPRTLKALTMNPLLFKSKSSSAPHSYVTLDHAVAMSDNTAGCNCSIQ